MRRKITIPNFLLQVNTFLQRLVIGREEPIAGLATRGPDSLPSSFESLI